MNEFEIKQGYFTVWDGKTTYDIYLNDKKHDYLPEPDKIYDLCRKRGYSSGKIIDIMLKFFHVDRLIKSGYLHDLSMVVGFVGPRGSGKSVGAVAYAIYDFLLDGKRVWSNMPIEVTVKYRDCRKIFRSESLDKEALMDINAFENSFADGLIVIDELNIEVGDSRRQMSNQMLWFDFMLQEVRKRKMNICYQLQSEEWAGSRSRWQTDLYIVCRDKAFLDGHPSPNDIGRQSRWRIHDMSGIVTGDIRYSEKNRNKVDYYQELYFWNTPFWNCYDTEKMQRYEKFDPSKKSDLESEHLTIDERTFSALTTSYGVIPELVLRVLDSLSGRILRREVWNVLQISDRATQTQVGTLLHSLGATDFRNSAGERGYILPDKEFLAMRLSELGVDCDLLEK